MKLHRYVDHQRLHIVTKDVISLSISVLLLFRHYISHKITFGAHQQWRGITQCLRCFYFYCVFVRTEMNLIAVLGLSNCINTQYAALSGAMLKCT